MHVRSGAPIVAIPSSACMPVTPAANLAGLHPAAAVIAPDVSLRGSMPGAIASPRPSVGHSRRSAVQTSVPQSAPVRQGSWVRIVEQGHTAVGQKGAVRSILGEYVLVRIGGQDFNVKRSEVTPCLSST